MAFASERAGVPLEAMAWTRNELSVETGASVAARARAMALGGIGRSSMRAGRANIVRITRKERTSRDQIT